MSASLLIKKMDCHHIYCDDNPLDVRNIMPYQLRKNVLISR